MEENNELQQSRKMGTMPEARLLLSMALPMMLSMLVQALYNIVDSIYVARVSEDCLAALSLAFPAQNIMIGLATGTGVGVGTLVSRALGGGDSRQANRAAGYSQANVMGQAGLIACYNLGAEWVDQLVEYIYGNVQYAKAFIAENLPKARVVDPDGTYLLWVDFSGYGIGQHELEDRILNKAKLWLDAGAIFGPETALFERFNLATPRSVVEEAMGRLKHAFEDLN